MHLSGLRVVPDPLLERRPGGVVPANDHQVAAENLVRLSILDVELERFRERLNGFADFSLGELAVAQGIPTPRGFRVLVDISSQERLNLLESPRSDVAFKLAIPWESSASAWSFESNWTFSLAKTSPGLNPTAFR